jgi:hypothetical protein
VIQGPRSRSSRPRRPRRVAGIIVTYQLAGLFGTAIAVTTMLGIAGTIVALTRSARSPIMPAALVKCPLPKEVRPTPTRRRRRQHHRPSPGLR